MREQRQVPRHRDEGEDRGVGEDPDDEHAAGPPRGNGHGRQPQAHGDQAKKEEKQLVGTPPPPGERGEKRGPGQEAAEVENEASKKQGSPRLRLRLLLRKQGSPRLRLRLLFQSLAGVPEPGLSLLYRPRRDWSRRECLMPLRCSV